MASPSRHSQGGALASWDRRMIQWGYWWARGASEHPCSTLFLSTTVAFLILKGTKNLHTSLPRSIRREALHIGIWSAQLVFFGTPLLMFAHHASRRVLKAIAELPQNRQHEGKEGHTDEHAEDRRNSLDSSASSIPGDSSILPNQRRKDED